MNLIFLPKREKYPLISTVLLFYFACLNLFAQSDSYSVMEIVEVTFNSQEDYDNPYMETDVWIELRKSDDDNSVYRIPVFWDGNNVFRARLVATSPGNWSWKVLNETVTKSDSGFLGRSGSFTAVPAEVTGNPNNRGFIRVDPNTKRTLQYADGTPFFFTADTSWSALTGVFDFDRSNSITEISFQDYILARKNQGFNGLNVIASFPDDTYLEQTGRNLDRPGTQTGLWASATWGKKIAPNGEPPFEMKTSSQRATDRLPEVDYKRINPKYWQNVDERMQFLSDQGFVTLFESVRRHERWPFRSQDEKDSFYNYIRYLWARYGCYNMIFSWVHHDTNSGNVYPKWLEMVKHANTELFKRIGDYQMPYGQPRTAMSFNSTLKNWERDIPSALDLQNVSNAERDEDMHRWLRDIYHDKTTKPALNLEPFYPGWGLHSGNEINEGLDDTTMAQMQMYGSVLSGGLAGHAWGDAWYAGAASSTRRSNGGTLVPINDPQKNALTSFESQAMGHLKDFILDSGHDYRRLVPAADTNLSDSKNYVHTLSISEDKTLALGFFTGTFESNPDPLPELTNLLKSKTYRFEWWDVTKGGWIKSTDITSSGSGRLVPPELPDNNNRRKSWAYRIRSQEKTTSQSASSFELRINSGGGEAIYESKTFDADTRFDTGQTLDRPQTGLESPYKTFRYSRSRVMGYEIPLENGEYTVRLHFAELWFGATGGGSGGKGSRVFDVRLEGQLAEDNLDVFAAVGPETALIREHRVTVSDGQLNIDFSSLAADGGTRHPIINAIEVFGGASVSDTKISLSQTSISLNTGEKDQLTATVSSSNIKNQELQWTSSDTSIATVDQNGEVTAISEGKAIITVFTDNGESQVTSTINVVSAPVPRPTLRINAGGIATTFEGNAFAADGHFDTGRTLDRPQTGLKGPHKTFRYSRSRVMGYEIPLENGEYTVRLHFAELWFGATGGGSGGKGSRVFDVRLEGQLAEDDLDVFAEVGAEIPLIREHRVTVSDGQLNIDFSSWAADGGTRHPIINAIEVLGTTNDNSGSAKLTTKVSSFPNVEDREAFGNLIHSPYANPNPTKGALRIDGLKAGTKEIKVLDFSGRILSNFKLNGANPKLDLSVYPPGIYVVKVLQDGVEKDFKVIKE